MLNYIYSGFICLILACLPARGFAMDSMKERLRQAALANPLVMQVIAQSANETSSPASACKIDVKSYRGEDTSTGLDGEIILSFACSGGKVEFARFGEISGSVVGSVFLVDLIKIDSAG